MLVDILSKLKRKNNIIFALLKYLKDTGNYIIRLLMLHTPVQLVAVMH